MSEHRPSSVAEILTAEQLRNALTRRTRTSIPAATDRSAWEAVDEASAAAVIRYAASDLGQEWPALLASQWRAFERCGERPPYEAAYFARRRRVVGSALALALTGDVRYLDDLIDGIWLIVEETTWCVPAHDTWSQQASHALPSPEHPVIDLFAAETAATLSWALHVHHEALCTVPGITDRISRELRSRILTPYRRTAREHFWYAAAQNWNAWVTCNVITTAILADEPVEELTEVLRLAAESLDGYLAGVPADGGCSEGIMYWWQSGARLYESLELFADLVPHRADDLFALPLVRRIARYPLTVFLDGPWSANFGDGNARAPRPGTDVVKDQNPPGLLYRFGRAVGDRDVMHQACTLRGDSSTVLPSTLGRALADLHDQQWRAQGRVGPALPPIQWLPELQQLTVRSSRAGGMRLVAKAGTNGDPHNHNDVGSFVIALGGEPVVIDAGTGTYTRASFGRDRYESWFTQSSFHNVPEFAGVPQAAGAAFAARDVRCTAEGGDAVLDFEFSDAYPDESGLISLRRTFRTSLGGNVVEVTDAWRCDGPPASVRLHLLLRDVPEIGEDGTVTTGGQAPLLIRIPDGSRVRAESIELDDRQLRVVWGEQIARLVVEVERPAQSGRVMLRFEPASDHF